MKLVDRKFLKVSGEDSFKFLQGLITKDVKHIKNKEVIYALLLTPQGKFLSDFFCFTDGDDIILDIHENFYENLKKKLKFFKLRSDVSVNDYPEFSVVVSRDDSCDAEFIFKDPRTSANIYRNYNKSLHEDLSGKDYNDFRLENGLVEACYDLIPEKSFPLEFSLDKFNAIDFDKGCYVGQELVARTHFRGVIRKKILKCSCSDFPEKFSELTIDGKKLGLVLSNNLKIGFIQVRIEDYEKNIDNNMLITDQAEFKILQEI